jgi:hypothetical protein
MKSSIFWDITPCDPLKDSRRFGVTCRLHLRGRKISQARNQRESRRQVGSGFRRRYVPSKRQLIFNGLHGVSPAWKQVTRWLCLPPAFTLVSCSSYSSTLKMEAICPSETSADFQRKTRHYVPEDRILQLTFRSGKAILPTLHLRNPSYEEIWSYLCLYVIFCSLFNRVYNISD